MTRLSVNINKIATLRNARGGNNPDVVKVALDCERFGAEGITIHPRPDERHIRYQDAYDLKKVLTTEFNIEGNPEGSFITLVENIKPHQVTLVPDAVDAITSNAGWDTIKHQARLKELIQHFKSLGIRVSVFVDPNVKFVEAAATAGADRIELYTEPYAVQYHTNKQLAVKQYVEAASCAQGLGMGINAGHDLDLHNLRFLKESIPFLDEVSISI